GVASKSRAILDSKANWGGAFGQPARLGFFARRAGQGGLPESGGCRSICGCRICDRLGAMGGSTSRRHLLAIDQGTSGTTVIVMTPEGETLGGATREFPQHFPRPGWVEHEPEEIWASVVEALARALSEAAAPAESIAAIGITNQR